jgi:membrane protein implicated in regulation of membrane protease activity
MNPHKKIWPSRGVPFSVFWPYLGLYLILTVIMFQNSMFIECIGRPLPTGRGAGVGVISHVLSFVCSPYLLKGSVFQIGLFVILCLILIMLVRLHYKLWLHYKYVSYLRQKDKEYKNKRAKIKD